VSLAAIIVHWLNRVTCEREARAPSADFECRRDGAIADRDFYRRNFAASAVEGNARRDGLRAVTLNFIVSCALP